MNIAMHFEIPVTDMTRAIGFYSRVFGITFERAEIDGNEMALFPLLVAERSLARCPARRLRSLTTRC